MAEIKEVLCVNCHRPIEPDPESVSGWWKHKDGKYSCFHNTNAEPTAEGGSLTRGYPKPPGDRLEAVRNR